MHRITFDNLNAWLSSWTTLDDIVETSNIAIKKEITRGI
jgi:hypothetical protein